MAKPISALSSVLGRRTEQFIRGANMISREAARAAGSAAVEATPVDTGLARSNWRASVNTQAASVIPPYAPGSKLGIGERGNALGAASQHRLTIASWNAARGNPLFIVNNVPYIAILNFGGRNSSPNNMLAMARQAWSASIRKPRRILV